MGGKLLQQVGRPPNIVSIPQCIFGRAIGRVGVSALANFGHAVEYGQESAIFAGVRWYLAPCFAHVRPDIGQHGRGRSASEPRTNQSAWLSPINLGDFIRKPNQLCRFFTSIG